MKTEKPPIRFSHLKAIGRSPAHAQVAIAGAEEETYAMERGTAVHALLFGTQRVVAWEEGKQRRGKKWTAFQDANADATILTHAEHEKAMRMAHAVNAHKDAWALLQGEREKTIHWQVLDRMCRGTPDCAVYSSHVTELKTCAVADPQRFTWQALRMGYTAQLAWYLDGISMARLGKPTDAYIVAVESSAPYPVTVLKLTDKAIEKGRRRYSFWLEQFMTCERSGEWPAYAQSIVDLDEPDDDVELDFGDAVEAA